MVMQVGLFGGCGAGPPLQPSVFRRGGTLGLPQLDLSDRLRMVRRHLLPLRMMLPCGRGAGGPGAGSTGSEPRPLSILHSQCRERDRDPDNQQPWHAMAAADV